jgi:hypothetical protein
MPCRSIADVLRGMGEIPPSDTEIVSDPLVSSAPWIRRETIEAARSRDVLDAIERGQDNRTFEQRSADATRARAAQAAAQPVKWKFIFSPKAAAKPRPKRERTAEVREYFREYQRRRRAEAKAEQFNSV